LVDKVLNGIHGALSLIVRIFTRNGKKCQA